ncbi:MAG: hypothetical protein J7501_02295, partial [Bdellovibrio sp.]|nr:hypothetical protein [Bdellovibrio sp.]
MRLLKHAWGEFALIDGKSNLELYKTVSENDYQDFIKHRDLAIAFFDKLDFLLMIEEARNNFFLAIENASKFDDPTNLMLMRSNRRSLHSNFFNLLNLARAMRDQFHAEASNTDRAVLKRIWSDHYDKNFSFRFFERLRNYSQHQSIP